MHERLADDLLITCDETSDIQEGAKVIPRNEINYWLIAIVLLSTACLPLLVVIIVKYI